MLYQDTVSDLITSGLPVEGFPKLQHSQSLFFWRKKFRHAAMAKFKQLLIEDLV
jgi:hypothetical protein